MLNRQIVVIALNIRSSHNVGSLLRTAEAIGAEEVYLCGFTPYPKLLNDTRLPYIAEKVSKQISKTALGAEKTLKWQHKEDIAKAINELKKKGYQILALEQSADSIDLPKFNANQKVAVIVGNEVTGIDDQTLKLADDIVSIPMFGQKESLNAVQALAMCLYKLRFH